MKGVLNLLRTQPVEIGNVEYNSERQIGDNGSR